MTDRPILFSAPMVRAILAGSKTQTRRVVKPWEPRLMNLRRAVPEDVSYLPDFTCYRSTCPYGQPGDLLWVRETWSTHACFDHLPPNKCPPSIHYWADGKVQTGKGRPSIHMPRWASRITLEVTGARVERLQAISDADAMAEGIVQLSDGGFGLPDGSHYHHTDPRQSYFSLWEAINGPGSVEADPWLWVIEFKKVDS